MGARKGKRNDSWGGHQAQRAGLGEQCRGRKEMEGGQERGDLRSVLFPCIYPDPSNETETLLLTGRNEALKMKCILKEKRKTLFYR